MSAIGMPGHLLAYFAPRQPLEPLPPPKKHCFRPFSGLTEFLGDFETTPPPVPEPFEPPKERKERLAKEKALEMTRLLKTKIACYAPFHDPEKVKTADPKKTLFVGRLSYETTEKKLLKTFEAYGPVRDIRLVTDKEGKPRGYAFIEFKTAEGLSAAYRNSKDKVLDGRRIVVDIERARTITSWLPRRLGGGEGPQRLGVSKKALMLQRSLEPRRTMGGTLGGSQSISRRGGDGPPRRGGRTSNTWSGDRRPPRYDRDTSRNYNDRHESKGGYDNRYEPVKAGAGYDGIKSEYEPKQPYESAPRTPYEVKGAGYEPPNKIPAYESGLKYESGALKSERSGGYERASTSGAYERGGQATTSNGYERGGQANTSGGYERGGQATTGGSYERGGYERGGQATSGGGYERGGQATSGYERGGQATSGYERGGQGSGSYERYNDRSGGSYGYGGERSYDRRARSSRYGEATTTSSSSARKI